MRIIAHRSGPATYPEQTIVSAREALKLGADMVEIDVRMTRDGQVAITHDRNLLRVFGEDVNIGDITASRFLAMRHQADCAFGAHLFEDYLRCRVFPLLIHIKEKETIAPMLELIARYDCAQQVTMGVNSVEMVEEIRAGDRRIDILSFAKTAEESDTFIAAGVNYVRLWEGWLNEESVRKIKESPSELWVMSGNTDGYPVGEPGDENLQRIMDFAPDGVLINDVRRMR